MKLLEAKATSEKLSLLNPPPSLNDTSLNGYLSPEGLRIVITS